MTLATDRLRQLTPDQTRDATVVYKPYWSSEARERAGLPADQTMAVVKSAAGLVLWIGTASSRRTLETALAPLLRKTKKGPLTMNTTPVSNPIDPICPEVLRSTLRGLRTRLRRARELTNTRPDLGGAHVQIAARRIADVALFMHRNPQYAAKCAWEARFHLNHIEGA